MKKRFVVLLMVFLLASCVDPVDSSTPESSSVSQTSQEVSTSESSESSSVDSSIEEPTTVSITNETLNVWYDETLQMNFEFSKEGVDDEVSWTSSDETVATISETGLVTPAKSGETTITVTSKEDAEITASVVVTVKDVILDTSYGFGNLDYSNLKSENPTVTTTKANATWPYCEAIFKNIYGQKYYAEATFNVTEINYGWTWNRISVGHRDRVEVDSNHVFRGLQLSYGPESGANKKTVMMETPNNWGLTTDRSQVWSLNDISTIDFTNVKLGALRDGNNYYYFINDELSWMEAIDTRFNGVDTMPTIVVGDMHATISNMFATDEVAYVDDLLAAAETNRKFFPAYRANTLISENDTKIQFVNNNNQWPFTNIKDNRALSFGDAARMEANTNYKVEFDLAFNEFGDNELALVGMTMNRWTSGPSNARTLSISKFRCGLTTWDSNGDMPFSLTAQGGNDYATPLAANTTYHIILERTIVDGNQSFNIRIDGTSYAISFSEAYTGPLTISFGCIYANATITNLAINAVVVN